MANPKPNVSFKSENKAGVCPGYICGDPKKVKKGIIVIQEWWGMNKQIVEQAAKISKAKDGGFVTLTPDLYRGKVAINHEEAGHLMSGLDWDGAVKDIKAAIDYLREEGCDKVGVTGYCMGGALTLATAASYPEDVDAAAPFYGIPGKDFKLEDIKCPVQCHFGEKDELAGFSSPADAAVLKERLKKSKAPQDQVELHMYKANHAFTHEGGPNYDKESSDLALGRMYDFMDKHLSSSVKL